MSRERMKVQSNHKIKFGSRAVVVIISLVVVVFAGHGLSQETPDSQEAKGIATVRVDSVRVVKKFDPDRALGTSIDILRPDEVDKVYSEPILQESLSAGWGPITYRQNTELQGAAWHWNPNGTWSDPRIRAAI